MPQVVLLAHIQSRFRLVPFIMRSNFYRIVLDGSHHKFGFAYLKLQLSVECYNNLKHPSSMTLQRHQLLFHTWNKDIYIIKVTFLNYQYYQCLIWLNSSNWFNCIVEKIITCFPVFKKIVTLKSSKCWSLGIGALFVYVIVL